MLPSSSDEITQNISLTGKSVFTVASQTNAVNGDFIVQKDSAITYQGIVDTTETVKENKVYKINAKEIDSLFDRKIILTNDTLISTVGIEDFIKQTILDNFSNSSDTLLNITYLDTIVLTHTVLDISLDVKDSIYNFKEFLGVAKEMYGIFLDYEFQNGKLVITISKKDLSSMNIDATISDVINCAEVYKSDIIAKVTVLATNTQTIFDFFLLADQTVTTDSTDINRAKGDVDTVSCTKDSEAAQKALDTFKSNSYQHNVVLTLNKNSKIYQPSEFIVGRPLKIKTKENGIYTTFVSEINKKSNSNIYTVTCGNMKVTLLEKLKGVV